MRIIAGKHRSRKLLRPPEKITRPTTDRVRENVFNILGNFPNFELTDATVLDCFAGSGAYGLEALSRGASFITLVEKDRKAAAIIRQNISALSEENCCKLIQADVFKLPKQSHPVNLVFMDPPYNKGLELLTLSHLQSQGWIDHGTLIVLESAHDTEFPELDAHKVMQERLYGASKVTFFYINAD